MKFYCPYSPTLHAKPRNDKEDFCGDEVGISNEGFNQAFNEACKKMKSWLTPVSVVQSTTKNGEQNQSKSLRKTIYW